MKRQINGDCPEIKIRAHHLLCIRGFQGYGYSEDFVRNIEELIKFLAMNPSTQVRIVDSTDDICRACPHRVGSECLKDDRSVRKMDSAVMELMKVKPGDLKIYSALKMLVEEIIASESIRDVCGDCSWREICLLHR